jgi:FAD:protein FMN transferase
MLPAGFHRFQHEAMATRFELILEETDAMVANGIAQEIFRGIDQLESELSRFVSYSDLSHIHAAKAGESVSVGAACLDCLNIGKEIWEETGGAFDVTIGPLYQILRNPDGTPRKASKKELEAAKAKTGFEKLQIDLENGTVTPMVDGMRLDLGAIGKGYALDQAWLDLEQQHGMKNALLNAGDSTVLGMGQIGTRGCWPVNAGDGTQPVELRNQALSGTGFIYKGAHIVDPRKAKMVSLKRHFRWSVAPQAIVADALSTAFMVMERAEIEAYCKRYPDVLAIF